MNKETSKKRETFSKAFTVLELLVVIAIIGLLSMITLMSLSSATFRGRDTKTISQLSQIPSKLAIEYASEGSYDNICLDEDNFSIDSGLRDVQLELLSRGKTIKCFADGDNYCISSELNDGNYYLVKNDLRFTDYEGCESATTGGGLGEGNIQLWRCGDDITFTYNGSSVTYGTVLNPTTDECWLDRNLGATRVALSSTDSDAYGDLFQWGRLDDGHQLRTSLTTSTLSTADNPNHSKFILNGSSPYDWRNPQNDNLWQGVSGTNNPCPTGFRIPTETELNAERLSWSSNNAAGAFNSPLKLTVAGYRSYSDGSLYNVGSYGYYWSSTVSGSYSRYLRFYSSNANMRSSYRAYGFTVRCLKD